jgi:hypothetical protein
MSLRRHGRRPIRLISILAATALVFAHVVGAYAHAAGHSHGRAHVGCAHDHANHAAATALPDQGVSGSLHLSCDQEIDHASCCDFMCHGGIAILATPALTFAEPARDCSASNASIARLLWPGSLDRPPKSFALA